MKEGALLSAWTETVYLGAAHIVETEEKWDNGKN